MQFNFRRLNCKNDFAISNLHIHVSSYKRFLILLLPDKAFDIYDICLMPSIAAAAFLYNGVYHLLQIYTIYSYYSFYYILIHYN